LWSPMSGIRVKDIGEILFLFVFNRVEDMERMTATSPWLFDNSVLTKTIKEEIHPSEIKLMNVSFCTCVHGVPLLCFSKDVRGVTGTVIGDLLDVEVVNG
ncbi:DUF4283 domain-containing protein, partial [Cephalotus follicularis]